MPIRTTIGCAALAIAACFCTGAASASPLVVNKSVSAATSQVQNVDYHCYRVTAIATAVTHTRTMTTATTTLATAQV